MVKHVPVPFVDTPLTSNVREAVEGDWSTNLNGPAVRLYGGEESAPLRVGDVVIRIGPAWRQLAELEYAREALPDLSERASDLELQLVAGAGFEPATFGL